MQSFDTKESFESKDSEVKEANNDVAESFDRKFESFESKHSEVELYTLYLDQIRYKQLHYLRLHK